MSDDNYEEPTIEVPKYGPYIVKGVRNFKNSKEEPIVDIPVMALCRCGLSKSKPFCDGSHTQIGFKGEKLSGRVEDKLVHYVGKGITVHDNRGVCSHAGFCTGLLPEVFERGKEPWIELGAIMVAQTEEENEYLEKEHENLKAMGIKTEMLSTNDITNYYTGKKFLKGLYFP